MHHMMYQDETLRLVHIADSHNQYSSKVLSGFET